MLGNAQTLFFIIFLLCVQLAACVIVPYEPNSELTKAEGHHLLPAELVVSREPREFLEKISASIAEADSRIEIIDPVSFREPALPVNDKRVFLIRESGAYRNVSVEADVDYLVLIHEQDISSEESGGMGWFIVFFGALLIEEEVRLSAVIINLQGEYPLHEVGTYTKGSGGAVGYAYLFAITPETQSSAIKAVGHEVAKTLTSNNTNDKIRVAVLAADEAARNKWDKRKIELLQRAGWGERDAHWELYQSLPNKEQIPMLCQAADLGQVEARHELGMLYFHGSDNYRKFTDIYVRQDLPYSCVWFHLVWHTQIDVHQNSKRAPFTLGPFEIAVIADTAKKMTADALREAENMYVTWKPGQCDRDFSVYLGEEYTDKTHGAEYIEGTYLAKLCMEADRGSMSAREALGRIYDFGSYGIGPDIPRAYMWYLLAIEAYSPPDNQTRCIDMTAAQRSQAAKYLEEWEPGKCEQELLQ